MTEDAEGRKQYDDRDFAEVYEALFGPAGEDGVTHRLKRAEDMLTKHIDSCEKRYKEEQRHRERQEEMEQKRRRWIIATTIGVAALLLAGVGNLIAFWTAIDKLQ